MATRNVNFRWSDEFIARVDEARGLIPRSAFVRAALEEKMGSGFSMGKVAERQAERRAERPRRVKR